MKKHAEVEGEVTTGVAGTGAITKLTFSGCGTSAGAENCTFDTTASREPLSLACLFSTISTS